MGGDTGGNDCVHVIDVRAEPDKCEPLDLEGAQSFSDADVLIHDEHGNVCRFTYQEWTDHVEKVHAGDFDHIAPEYYSPEDIVPIKLDLSGVGGRHLDDVFADAIKRLEALPLTSVDISGTFETAEVRCTCQPLRPLDVPTRAETLKQFEAAGFTAPEDGR